MLHTQTAYAGSYSDSPNRIELDASRLRFMTEAARRMLVVATHRLAARQIELVVVGCDPFG
jgi:anti-anti-sigma regulatory factor